MHQDPATGPVRPGCISRPFARFLLQQVAWIQSDACLSSWQETLGRAPSKLTLRWRDLPSHSL